MKKLLAILVALMCIFSVAFVACKDSGNGSGNGDPVGGEENGGEENGGEDPDHECDYDTDWSQDSQYHWHASLCSEHPDEKFELAEHTYVNGKCNVCNQADPNYMPEPADTIPSSSLTGFYDVGDKVPRISFDTFNSQYTAGSYDTANAEGKVLIINFWYKSCGVCIDEMPDIEELNKTYGDDIVVVALHKDNFELPIGQSTINSQGWSSYKTIFGKDIGDAVFKTCGFAGNSEYPITLVVGKDGTIIYKHFGNIISFNMETFARTNMLAPHIEAELAK